MTDHSGAPNPDRAEEIKGWPRPLAFVLSGGGSYGAAHVGMVRALAEAGIGPDVIVGSSVGALNGVVVAARPVDGADHLGQVWARLDRGAIFGPSRIRAVGNLLRSRRSLCRPDHLIELITAHCPATLFDELPTRFAAVATDALTGRPEVLSTGPLLPALLASSALPGVFPPVEIDGATYLDGGVAANVPVGPALGIGARSLVVLDAMPPQNVTRVPTGLVTGLFHAVTLLVKNQAGTDVLRAGTVPLVELPSVTPPDIRSIDFGHTAELIDLSYAAATEFLRSQPGPTGVTAGADGEPRPR